MSDNKKDIPLRLPGIALIVVAGVAVAAYFLGLALPTLQWFFSFRTELRSSDLTEWQKNQAAVLGCAMCGILAALGVWLLVKGRWKPNPMTLRRWQRFKSLRRGWWSFLILIFLVFLALLDQALVGKRALFVSYQGRWYFPAFLQRQLSEQDFGGKDDSEPNYRALKERLEREGEGHVVLPLVPWAPVYDSDDTQTAPLQQAHGLWERAGEDQPYSGRACRYYPFKPGTPQLDRPLHSEYRFRRGLLDGEIIAYAPDGTRISMETWRMGKMIQRETTPGASTFNEKIGGEMTVVVYPPAPPSFADRHFLGTSSNGWDIAAQIYGGFQVILKAALIYLAITYFFGILLGCAMGYFGGWIDLISQRLIEILSTIPFLLLVVVIVQGDREGAGLITILAIICCFSWMGVATYMRTAALREKSRDYIAAARLAGAGTGRIIFRHLAPNALSTIVTLIPFSVVSIAYSITALDFINFGLPDSYPSWGRTLGDGLKNLDAPWIVWSVALAMFVVLLLFTFIGEAIREAFDPKKFTVYQ